MLFCAIISRKRTCNRTNSVSLANIEFSGENGCRKGGATYTIVDFSLIY